MHSFCSKTKKNEQKRKKIHKNIKKRELLLQQLALLCFVGGRRSGVGLILSYVLQLAVDMANPVAVEPAPVQAISGADEILKYKQLLDAGIISEAEFNTKKTQILGL